MDHNVNNHEAINVLFTSVGRRVELVRAFHRAYKSLGLKGNIIGLDIDPLAPAIHHVDRPFLVPRLSSPNYIPTLCDICIREQVGLIFPLIDPDIPVLASHRKEIEATGARLAAVSSEAARACADKWLTYKLFRSLDLSTPHSWLPEEPTLGDICFPVFIKPRDGSAAKNTFPVRNQRELDFFLDYIPNPIIQEYVEGKEITSDVICSPDGEVLAVVSRQRIETRSGEVSKAVTIRDSRIIDACVTIAHHFRAAGPITVQCIMRDGIPFFTEVNARLGGGIPLGIAAGVDSPRWLLAKAANIPIEIPPVGTYKTGLYMTRFDDSVFLDDDTYKQLKSNHI